jgi:hypothetical protein
MLTPKPSHTPLNTLMTKTKDEILFFQSRNTVLKLSSQPVLRATAFYDARSFSRPRIAASGMRSLIGRDPSALDPPLTKHSE